MSYYTCAVYYPLNIYILVCSFMLIVGAFANSRHSTICTVEYSVLCSTRNAITVQHSTNIVKYCELLCTCCKYWILKQKLCINWFLLLNTNEPQISIAHYIILPLLSTAQSKRLHLQTAKSARPVPVAILYSALKGYKSSL